MASKSVFLILSLLTYCVEVKRHFKLNIRITTTLFVRSRFSRIWWNGTRLKYLNPNGILGFNDHHFYNNNQQHYHHHMPHWEASGGVKFLYCIVIVIVLQLIVWFSLLNIRNSNLYKMLISIIELHSQTVSLSLKLTLCTT